jgi:hypothetical protein
MSFLLCQSCSRHVKSSDAACPFCGEATATATTAGTPALRGARQRSRLLFGAAAAAVAGATAMTGCSSSSTSVPAYGLPADSGAQADSGDDGGSVVLYGAPADAGDQDTGGPVPLYGAAQVDAGGD